MVCNSGRLCQRAKGTDPAGPCTAAMFLILSSLVLLAAQAEGQAATLASPLLALPPFHVTCVGGPTSNNQSCIFNNVCFQRSLNSGNRHHQSLDVFLQGTDKMEHVALLQQHLQQTLHNVYAGVNCTGNMATGSNVNASDFMVEHATTLLWRPWEDLQNSFGHVIVDEVFPMFVVLLQHFKDVASIPRNLQLLVTPHISLTDSKLHHSGWHPAMHRIAKIMLAQRAHLFTRMLSELPQGKSGVCFRHLIVGDLGYGAGGHALDQDCQPPSVKRFSCRLSWRRYPASGPPYTPYNNSNWWAFRQHALLVAGHVEQLTPPSPKPLVLLNDKRRMSEGKLNPDKRMIIDVDGLAANLSTAYPDADILLARFRDMDLSDQMRLVARANVLITTQGSSSFLFVFLPPNATCVVLGSPTEPGQAVWLSFFEWDVYFQLSYINVERYEVSLNSTDYVEIQDRYKDLGVWQPEDATTARWWSYFNSDVRVNLTRLLPYLNKALKWDRGISGN